MDGLACGSRGASSHKGHQIPAVKGSKNGEFRPLGASFGLPSEKSIHKGPRDTRLGPATPAWSSPLLRLRSAVGEVQAYLRANAASLVDHARRYLRGQRISTAVVESMVNRVIGRRMAKKQPMRWSRRGAHLLVHIRLRVLGRARAARV